ncbi:curli production assembly/transport component CsgF [Duganella sp. CF517]|uniref:curli assembly protein CsgF n=1 Tax=Duganella sp. CF517 TaxID=1881038 RepID=UPI0008C3735B|nr:curli assembly protein CsgF [Duganella sp. CF517]SEN20227.1 curli production assembly/transport component CsgF [Duganella sp. CF517]
MPILRSTRRVRTAARLAARVAVCATLLASGAGATDIVYQPVNPAFGGYPANGQHLLATATATNTHVGKDSPGRSLLDQSPLAQFNQTLERTVLSQLAAAATSKLTGADGKLVPGTFSTQNFTINVVDLGGGMLRITTTDKATGASTSFEVAQ